MSALHVDGLGSVRAVTDDTGAAVERTGYRPYGEEVALQQPLTLPEAKGFIGERLDGDAGLQYLNARYYDPRLGVFVQPDWWEVTRAGVGTNRYGYAFGDPVNGRDPGGHSWLGDAVRDIGRSIRDSFGALGDALSGKANHIDNAGQYANGNYGVVRVGDQTFGCLGCKGTGSVATNAVANAAGYALSRTLEKYGNDLLDSPGSGITFRLPYDGNLVADPPVFSNPILREIWHAPGMQIVSKALLELSLAERVEYGFEFFRNASGEIVNSPPIRGAWNAVSTGGYINAIATLHTHWANVGPNGQPMHYGPGPTDQEIAIRRNIPGFVVNWDGRVFGF